ncbi:hypothetical protein FA13DRAFT_1285303 [Coprinellus micaceus]|uniref:Uncharacterized protein n=1 Tax=Coprinellus micaceus TaxID=71717 RepID=A0A4Y7R6A3_COPMI|nr:hypothetical protein FA13DRAFT_1285303 [Coprinellus micaceus]
MKRSSSDDCTGPPNCHTGSWRLTLDQDVEADKAAFQKTQEEERAKQARNRQVQADINKKRDEVARRKMEKTQNREWDSGKPAATRSRNWAQEVEKDKAAPQKDGSWDKQVAAEESQPASSGWDTKGEYYRCERTA